MSVPPVFPPALNTRPRPKPQIILPHKAASIRSLAPRAGKKGANKSTKMLEIKKPTTLLSKYFLLPLFATKAIKMIFIAIVCIPTGKSKPKGNATALIIVAKPVIPPAASPLGTSNTSRPTAKIAQPRTIKNESLKVFCQVDFCTLILSANNPAMVRNDELIKIAV